MPKGPAGRSSLGRRLEGPDQICCFNRDYAESSGYWQNIDFPFGSQDAGQTRLPGDAPITFYDTITGKALFVAPQNRSFQAFLDESAAHGWPSFRDAEVVVDNVRVLPDGETVSIDGTHLGHNLPDYTGNRYCINLVSVSGRPATAAASFSG